MRCTQVHNHVGRQLDYLRHAHQIELQTLIVEYLPLDNGTITLNGFLGCEPDGVAIMAELVDPATHHLPFDCTCRP